MNITNLRKLTREKTNGEHFSISLGEVKTNLLRIDKIKFLQKSTLLLKTD